MRRALVAFETMSGDVPHPGGRRRLALGYVDGGEGDDWANLAVFEHGEIASRQAPYGQTAIIEHGHVQLDDVHSRPERRLRGCRRLRCDADADCGQERRTNRQGLLPHAGLRSGPGYRRCFGTGIKVLIQPLAPNTSDNASN
jgi:hypothetical protein